jgi:hypothetical protein
MYAVVWADHAALVGRLQTHMARRQRPQDEWRVAYRQWQAVRASRGHE